MGKDDSELVMLTKERLLRGAAMVEEFETEVGIFKIRPLNKGEQAKADTLAIRGIKTKGKASTARDPEMEMDVETLIKNDWDVKFHIIACGLSVEKTKFTAGEVRMFQIPNTVMDQLADRIREISGMKEVNDMLQKFRLDGDGERAGDDDPDGRDEADGESGGSDTTPE